jgi:hypothetical protein
MNLQGKLYAYISDLKYFDMKKLKEGDISQVTFSTHENMTNVGWTRLGELDVSFDVVSDNEIVKNAVEALRAKQAAIRAEATNECTKIDSLVNQLLCIENSVPAAAPNFDDVEF